MKFALPSQLTLVFFGLVVLGANAQNNRLNDPNNIGWFNNFTTIKFSSKWSAHLEYQWRRDNFITTWQQSLFRTGINYQAAPNLVLRAGYAWIETFPYGDFPLQAAGKRFPEHRIYQMATLSNPIGRLEVSHRFMLEQRWIGRYTAPTLPRPDDFVFLNRMRYMVRLQYPLNNKTITDRTWYAAAYDEVLAGFGKNVNANVFDQNRLGLLLGYRFNKTWRVEGGFLQQILQFGRLIDNRNVFQYNNGLIVNTYLNVNWSKKTK